MPGPDGEETTNEKRGRRHDDATKRAARALYASGLYPSDNAIATDLDVARITVSSWRRNSEPDGVSWDEFRERVAREAGDQLTEALGESLAEVNIRHARLARQAMGLVVAALQGGRLFVDLRDLDVDPGEGDPLRFVDRVFTDQGVEVSLTAIWPQSLDEWVRLYAEAAKQERLARGEASERIEVWNEAQDEMTELWRRALLEMDVENDVLVEFKRGLEKVFVGVDVGFDDEGEGDEMADRRR